MSGDQVLYEIRTLDQLASNSLARACFLLVLFSVFAAVALLLACIGIYGVLSFVTAGRTQELGIRAALGASRGDLIRMVVGSGSVPVFVGIAAGFGGAVGLTRFIQSMLFATSPLDVMNLVAVAVLLLVVALLVCLAPAWRAARHRWPSPSP